MQNMSGLTKGLLTWTERKILRVCLKDIVSLHDTFVYCSQQSLISNAWLFFTLASQCLNLRLPLNSQNCMSTIGWELKDFLKILSQEFIWIIATFNQLLSIPALYIYRDYIQLLDDKIHQLIHKHDLNQYMTCIAI